ncbi:unnamed protein product [Sphagnum jensenii]
MNEALGKEKQFKDFFSNVQAEMRQVALEDDQRWSDDEKQLQRRIQEVQSKVRVRLEDNFDTGGAVSELLLLVKDVHSYFDKCNSAYLMLEEGKLVLDPLQARELQVQQVLKLRRPDLDAFALFRDQVRIAARDVAPKEKLLELADREQKLKRKQQQEAGFVSKQIAPIIPVKRLYPTNGKDDDKATFDVIFVHGLKIDAGTDLEETWRNKDNILWPQKWLPEDLEKIRVFSFSYDAEATKWFSQDNTDDVEDIGENLLQNVVWGSEGIGSRPFALVGHSFGGLVIKALVNEARRSSGRAERNSSDGRAISKAKEFLKNLKLVVFYAVPHSGADAESLTDYVNYCSGRAASWLPENMKPFSRRMAKMSVMMEDAFYNKKINVYAFGEGQPTYRGKVCMHALILGFCLLHK